MLDMDGLKHDMVVDDMIASVEQITEAITALERTRDALLRLGSSR
jgi:hypothetical protein